MISSPSSSLLSLSDIQNRHQQQQKQQKQLVNPRFYANNDNDNGIGNGNGNGNNKINFKALHIHNTKQNNAQQEEFIT